jgi:electron transport complex, rnfABCDGE type, G subunit
MRQKKDALLKKMLIALGVITVVAAAILGAAYVMTENTIKKGEQDALLKAIDMVAAGYDNDPVAEKVVYKLRDGCKDSISLVLYPLKSDNVFNGAVVESSSPDGFSGDIHVIYGFNADGTIRNYHVLKHAETAGLGAKMQDWFREKKGDQSIIGLDPQSDSMAVKKDGGDIDGITAATITSRAFLSALRDAAEALKRYKKDIGVAAEAVKHGYEIEAQDSTTIENNILDVTGSEGGTSVYE